MMYDNTSLPVTGVSSLHHILLIHSGFALCYSNNASQFFDTLPEFIAQKTEPNPFPVGK